MRAALLALAITVAAVPAVADEASGPAVVLDGDTIRIADTTIRLFGIDATESAQTCSGADGKSYKCGQAATERVEALTRGKTVSCSGSEKDQYGCLLARCTVGAVSINGTLVREGLAWAFIRYSSAFAAEEADARLRKVGVFAAQNEPPWEYRGRRWEAAGKGDGAAPTGDCVIKGNVSRKGERIYHMPWQLDNHERGSTRGRANAGSAMRPKQPPQAGARQCGKVDRPGSDATIQFPKLVRSRA